MALIANPQAHAEAVSLAQSIRLFGMQAKMMSRLHDADYRSALMLCRRALACEEEHFSSNPQTVAPAEHMEDRKPLLRLLAMLNSLRVEVRTRVAR